MSRFGISFFGKSFARYLLSANCLSILESGDGSFFSRDLVT